MKKKQKRKLVIIALVVLLILAGGVSGYLFLKQDTTQITSHNTQKSKKEYKHTLPERISKNDFFKGEFISNDIASVYPRRDALVRDILVDIGDEVKAGDTLAILFNPGVGGEGQSKINLKNTVVSTKSDLLEDAIKVKEAKIAELDQKINEKEVILEETINNFDSKISQIGNDSIDGSEYSVGLKGLENLKNNYQNAQTSRDQLLEESTKNISQKTQLLEAKVDEVYNNIIPILYIGNQDDANYVKINSYDFSDQFGVKDSKSLNKLLDKLREFQNTRESLELESKYNGLIEINNLLVVVLQNTIVSVITTEDEIQGYIADLNNYNTALISQMEVLDDAKNDHKVLELSQVEKIENLELQILKKENELALISTKGQSTESEKQLSVEKLKAEIQTLKKSRDLLVASEDKSITALENEIAIAKADLNSEYIKSGDYKIVSPFSGVISKRGIEIGEKISPSQESFRISGVETTLSRITKKEVKFYVPENLKDNLTIGNEVFFSLGDSQNSSFTGEIYRISPEVDEESLSIIVQAKVDEIIKLPNKSTLRVHLETQQEIFKIPSSTIYNKDTRKIVYYKKDNGKLGVRDINILSEDGEYSLVSGEFDEELKIVTTPIFIK